MTRLSCESQTPSPAGGRSDEREHRPRAGTPCRRTGPETRNPGALAGVITTGEGLARAFWQVLAPAVAPLGSLRRVSVVETAKNRFEYRGEAG